MKKKKIIGRLLAHSETGTEGLIWTLEENGKKDYDGHHPLKKGDHLKILNNEKNAVLFDGIINPDYETGKVSHPNNKQPNAFGYWIHWTQKDWHQDAWAIVFLAGLHAELIKS